MNHSETITDFLTGREIPNIGSEMNRQALEQYLVEDRGFEKKELLVDQPLSLMIQGELYHTTVDMMITVDDKKIMAVKCAAGSLGSREREALAMARLAEAYQIPYAIVSDGKTAHILDTVSGKKIGQGLPAIPSRSEIREQLPQLLFQEFPAEKKEREKLIFRSYDSMNINVAGKGTTQNRQQ
jgi:hypothetical protein